MLNQTLRLTRKRMKMERIARLELLGYSDPEIAMHLGCTANYVSVLRMQPEFVQIRLELGSGLLASLTNDLEEDIKASQFELKALVPAAINVIKNTIYDQNTPPKLKYEAAKEILDREGSLAKVSKTEIKRTDIFSFTHDAVADNLLTALQGNTATQKTNVVTTVETVESTTMDEILDNDQEKLNQLLDFAESDVSNLPIQ